MSGSVELDSASTETIKEPTSFRAVANILGTSEPEQPTDEKTGDLPGEEAKTPEGEKEPTKR